MRDRQAVSRGSAEDLSTPVVVVIDFLSSLSSSLASVSPLPPSYFSQNSSSSRQCLTPS